MKLPLALIVLCLAAVTIGPGECAPGVSDQGAGAAAPSGGPKYVRMAIIKGKRTRIPGPPLRRAKAQ